MVGSSPGPVGTAGTGPPRSAQWGSRERPPRNLAAASSFRVGPPRGRAQGDATPPRPFRMPRSTRRMKFADHGADHGEALGLGEKDQASHAKEPNGSPARIPDHTDCLFQTISGTSGDSVTDYERHVQGVRQDPPDGGGRGRPEPQPFGDHGEEEGVTVASQHRPAHRVGFRKLNTPQPDGPVEAWHRSRHGWEMAWERHGSFERHPIEEFLNVAPAEDPIEDPLLVCSPGPSPLRPRVRTNAPPGS
jgi:hypothetical protein